MLNGENIIKLKEVCSIRSGQTFKNSLNSYNKGNIAVLLPKDIVNSDDDIGKDILMINNEEIPTLENHLLKDGEIVIVNRGSRFNSWTYKGFPQKTVVTTAFYIITLHNKEEILPEFLNWYLNQQKVKDYLELNANGTTIKGINKTILMELSIPKISFNLQNHLINFLELIQKEQKILIELQENRKAYAEKYIWEQINKQ